MLPQSPLGKSIELGSKPTECFSPIVDFMLFLCKSRSCSKGLGVGCMLHKIPGVFLDKNINKDIGRKKFQQCCNPSSLMVDQVGESSVTCRGPAIKKKWYICTEWQSMSYLFNSLKVTLGVDDGMRLVWVLDCCSVWLHPLINLKTAKASSDDLLGNVDVEADLPCSPQGKAQLYFSGGESVILVTSVIQLWLLHSNTLQN